MPRTGSGWLDGSGHDEDSDDKLLDQMGDTYRQGGKPPSSGGGWGCAFALIAGVAALAIGVAYGVSPAQAVAPVSVTSVPAKIAKAQGVYHVPPITCETSTACVLDFYGGTTAPNDGYWMAKRAVNGTKWVRLTSVPGMDNTYVAPITCTQEDSCVQAYYNPDHYLMARQMDGTKWVRESLIPGVGA